MASAASAAKLGIRMAAFTSLFAVARLTASLAGAVLASRGEGSGVWAIPLDDVLEIAMLGLISGALMAVVAARCYAAVDSPRQFHLIMALIPCTVFLTSDPLGATLAAEARAAGVADRALTLGILLLASQLAARVYMRENSVRKQKGKS